MLPVIAKALHETFGNGKSDKVIGVTGSMLPPSVQSQDVDYNIGGVIGAIRLSP